jgi:hypothetical protein
MISRPQRRATAAMAPRRSAVMVEGGVVVGGNDVAPAKRCQRAGCPRRIGVHAFVVAEPKGQRKHSA